jgi:hypothetical protein
MLRSGGPFPGKPQADYNCCLPHQQPSSLFCGAIVSLDYSGEAALRSEN